MTMKKIISLCLAFTLLFSSFAYGADLYTVYDLKKETKLSKGITHERIEKFTSQGWMNINVVRADLTDEYTKIGPVTSPNGISNRDELSDMLEYKNAVAGVNGDFFYMGSPTYSYGALIDNGNVITSPLPLSYGYPTVSRTYDGGIDVSVWNPKITLHATDGTLFDVLVYNKTSALDYGPIILTKDWNAMSIGTTSSKKDIVEVVVIDNYVSEVRINQPAIAIPENGFIIASTCYTKQKLIDCFIPGNPISMDIAFDFAPENLEWAFGGLNHLVKDGKINKISDEVIGAHPRTAIGFNKDNTQMLMVTVDGRNKNYTSIKQTELAQIMIELGAYNVINMDGGGSTTMGVDFLQNGNIKVVNFPSDGAERKIASGVAVFNTAPKSDIINNIKIVAKDTKVFNNTQLNLDLQGFNDQYAQVPLDKAYANYTVEPATVGTVSNGIFTPTSPGKATITAYLGEFTDSINVEILDKPIVLNFNSDDLVLNNSGTHNIGDIVGVDKNGNSAIIPSNNITYTYKNNVGKVVDGVFTASDTNSTGAITATFGEATKNIKVKVGYNPKTLYRFETLDGLNLNLYPTNSSGNMSISTDVVKEGNNSLKLSYDFTKMTDQSIAFVEFGKDGVVLEGKPQAIGMWVYGDGQNHWLRTRITDKSGTQYKIDFAEEVNWTGWKWVTAKIPENITYPITLKNIYLAEINETRKGTGDIYIDNLRVLYEPVDKNLNLKPDSVFHDPLNVSKIGNYTEKVTISPEKSQVVDASGNKISKGKIIYFNGIITNGTLDPTNKTQWNNIKSLPKFKDSILILSLNQDLDSIYDKREIRVLTDILGKAAVNNQVFVVSKGTANSISVKDGIRYVSYANKFELGISSKGTVYTNK